jgi:hypothetical protein
MGRGLSELQKYILKMAYANHIREDRLVPRWATSVIESGRAEPLKDYYVEHNIPHIFYNGGEPKHFKAFFDNRKAADKHAEWLKEQGYDFRYSWETLRDFSDTRGFTFERDCDYEGADLYTYEVLADFFRFSEAARIQMNGKPCQLRNPEGKRTAGDKHFGLAKIGRERHNAAQATTSRAFKRLSERDLIFYGSGGIHLTKDGFNLAKELSVNSSDSVITINR